MTAPNFSPELVQALAGYTPPESAKPLLDSIRTLLLVGISGAGKDSTKHGLLRRYPGTYHHIVSHTTRQPRLNKGVPEQNGVEYHFIDIHTAEVMVRNRAFVEVKMYSDNLYGTSLAEFQLAHDEGKVALTDLEVQGVAEYVAITRHIDPVFILPPSYEVWQQRMMQRYGAEITAHQGDLQKRYQTAAKELEFALSVDYFHFVINDMLDSTVAEIHTYATTDHPPEQSEEAVAVARKLLEDIKEKNI